MTRRALTPMAVILITAAMSWAQDLDGKVLLRYKWNAGEEVSCQVAIEAEGDMVMTDMTKEPPEETRMHISQTMNMPLYQTIEAVDGEGNGTVAYQMGIMEMDMTAGDQPAQHIVIDPVAKTMTVNGEPAPLPDTALGYFGAVFRMVMSPLGEVLSFEAPDMERNLPDMMGLSATQFAQMARTSQMQLPEEPISAGYSWAQTVDLSTPRTAQEGEEAEGEAAEAAPMTLTMVYTLVGFETAGEVECAKMELVGAMDMTMTVSPQTEGADLVVHMGPMHVSMHGFTYFDPEAGCVVSTEIDQIMDMRQETRGQVQVGDQTQDINMITTTEDFRTNTVVTREEEG
jgi:hypothetical protein